MLNIVLVEPEIPSNTGNIGRTCVITGARLHLVGRLGFDLGDPALARAGLNYWHSLEVVRHASWEAFEASVEPGARLHLLTKRAARVFSSCAYADGDYLVFGKESTGLAAEILQAHPDACERIPMLPDAVALDDGPAWAARHDALVEAGAAASPRRDICGNFVLPGGAGISSLNLSNAVAIVAYEALRQLGYPGM